MKRIKLTFVKEEKIDGVFEVDDEMYDYLKAFNHYNVTEHRAEEKLDNRWIASKVRKFLSEDLFKSFKHYNTVLKINDLEINENVDKGD